MILIAKFLQTQECLEKLELTNRGESTGGMDKGGVWHNPSQAGKIKDSPMAELISQLNKNSVTSLLLSNLVIESNSNAEAFGAVLIKTSRQMKNLYLEGIFEKKIGIDKTFA